MASDTRASLIWLFVPPGLPREPELVAALLASAMALSEAAPAESDDQGMANDLLESAHRAKRVI